jgi:hypothetical protein
MQQGGGDPSAFMPKGMIIKIKGENSLVTMEGGMMAGDILHTKDKSVRLDRQARTYSVLPTGENPSQPKQQPSVTKTSETMKIMGYTCTKYVSTMTEGDRVVTNNIWATTEIKDIDVKALAKQRMKGGQSMFSEKVDGVPLRIESNTKEGNMIMEVTEIKHESLNAADFTIPADFTETQGMYGREK